MSIEDRPGGLHKVLKVLADNEIGVDYIYSTIRAKDDRAVIMIKVEDPAKAIEILKANDIRLVDTVELTSN